AHIALDPGGRMPVLTFGPQSVLPARQRQGIGKRLVQHTRTLAAAMGYAAILIYGDPAIYRRLGFVPAERYGIATADNHYHDALQAFALQAGALDGAAGRFVEGDAYAVDAEAAAAFDSQFPIREKREGLPSQLRFLETLRMHRPR
ncbi:MAG: N-acetyltransferase, partial [Candidatus Limiplasma sp.]|nr:N-acetyltransferase [Candidatus Limiplasma sp.]